MDIQPRQRSEKFHNCCFHLFCLVDFITLSGGGRSKEDSTQLGQWTWSNLRDIPAVNICITLHNFKSFVLIEDWGSPFKRHRSFTKYRRITVTESSSPTDPDPNVSRLCLKVVRGCFKSGWLVASCYIVLYAQKRFFSCNFHCLSYCSVHFLCAFQLESRVAWWSTVIGMQTLSAS